MPRSQSISARVNSIAGSASSGTSKGTRLADMCKARLARFALQNSLHFLGRKWRLLLLNLNDRINRYKIYRLTIVCKEACLLHLTDYSLETQGKSIVKFVHTKVFRQYFKLNIFINDTSFEFGGIIWNECFWSSLLSWNIRKCDVCGISREAIFLSIVRKNIIYIYVCS